MLNRFEESCHAGRQQAGQETTQTSRISAPRISVAVPLYNEEIVLPELYRRLGEVLAFLPGGPHEIVFVDDGSGDGTAECLTALAQADPRVTFVRLSRNFGHQAAIDAALDHASGDVVVIMDGDLQDTPETIPDFLALYAEGYDVVYAVRTARKEGRLLRWCYAAAYRLIAAVAEIDMPLEAGDFALLSRRVVDEMRRAPERQRYLRGLRRWVGFRQTGLAVERAARQAGCSKYTLRKLVRLACDGLLSFSLVPLRAAVFAGISAMIGGLALGVISAVAAVHGVPLGLGALLLSAMSFFCGVQLVFLGVLGEYIGRIYTEVKGRPRYIVDQVVRSEFALPVRLPSEASVAGAARQTPVAIP